MAKAHIKTPNGTDIVIEGDPAEVAKIISQVQGGITEAPRATRASKAPDRKREVKKQQTATDRVTELKENGFFDKPKGLGEVKTELQNSGFLYPVTTLSGVMLTLVQRKLLTRAKTSKGWVYGNR